MTEPHARHALIMAAGRGMRMMPLTQAMPKAMAPYNGTTLIAHGIEKIRRHIPNIHVTVGYQGAMLAQHVIQHGAATVLNTEGHGNAWWLYNTFLSLLDEPVVVLTCDNVMELDFARLHGDYVRYGEPACMIVPVKPVEGLEGDYIFHDDHVVTRLSRVDPAPLYCSGIQIVNPTKVRRLTADVGSFTQIWEQLIQVRELRASQIYAQQWFAVDTVEQLEAAADAANDPRIGTIEEGGR
jgi:NDP-sugar pyrophosphorylase family protein